MAPTTTGPADEEPFAKPRRPRWLEKYQQVLELHQQGCSDRKIARQLLLHRGTVRRWLMFGCLPIRTGRGRRSRSEPWTSYLSQRWQAGCDNAVTLTKELQQQGYKGSYDSVKRFVAKWRNVAKSSVPAAARAPPPPSAKLAAWWLLKRSEDRTDQQEQFVRRLCEVCPRLEQATSLAAEFVRLIHDRQSQPFPDWLQRATAAELVEMRRFAKGLQTDIAAVTAALNLPWSNGQTEGQVNKVKLIKRQMFGRAKFDLLRARVLAYG